MKHAQISFEFIMIFGLVLMSLTAFIYVIHERIADISIEQEKIVMRNLANNIINEIIIASSVSDNYMRKFDIPVKLLGSDYKILMENNDISIQVFEGDYLKSEYFTPLPVQIKGGFMQNLSLNTTGHCITKNKIDGLRISRNQASLDASVFQVNQGDEFEVYVSLYCIVNIKSIRITVRYDPDILEIINSEPIVHIDPKYENRTPLFHSSEVVYDYSNTSYSNSTIGRFTYGYIGSDCSSGFGDVMKFKFKVKENAALGETLIEFDERIKDSIRLLDCATSKFTKEGLPDSKKGTKIIVSGNPLPPPPVGLPLFYLKNNLGENIASFRDSGDIVLKGNCNTGICSSPGNDALVIQDSNSDTVAYIDDQGNLCLEDNDCNYQDIDCSNPPDGSFIIKDDNDIIVSYIGSSGQLCTKGVINQNSNP